MEVIRGSEDPQSVEAPHDGAHGHRPEELERRLGPFLPGFVDLRGSHRLGERQRRVLDHDAAEDGHEHDAQNAAQDHERRSQEVLLQHVLAVEVPELQDHERGNREDRARRDRLTDRADGPGEVLLEDRAAADAQQRHADDRRRVGRGDRHAGAQAQVGVGRPQDDAHAAAEQQRPHRELGHRRVGRHERPESRGSWLIGSRLCHRRAS